VTVEKKTTIKGLKWRALTSKYSATRPDASGDGTHRTRPSMSDYGQNELTKWEARTEASVQSNRAASRADRTSEIRKHSQSGWRKKMISSSESQPTEVCTEQAFCCTVAVQMSRRKEKAEMEGLLTSFILWNGMLSHRARIL
jgi:hypothetical protein